MRKNHPFPSQALLGKGAASLTHALAPFDDAGLALALRNLVCYDDACERAALDALADVWRASPAHVAFLADAWVRRGVVRPSAVATWVFNNDTPWSATLHLGDSFTPNELIDVAVDRSLDGLSAALAADDAAAAGAVNDNDDDDDDASPRAESEAVKAQRDEAAEVALEIFSRLARGVEDLADDDSARADAWRDAALATLETLKHRYDHAEAANLPGTRRSAPKRRLARVLDRDALREKLDVTGTVKTAVHRALGL